MIYRSFHLHSLQEDLLLACDDVRAAGEEMHRAGSEFARDTFRADKRAAMAAAGRQLLLAATRLMTVADAVDVSRLLNASKRVSSYIHGIIIYTLYNVVVFPFL